MNDRRLIGLFGMIGVALALYSVDLLTSTLQAMLPITIVLNGIASPVVVAGSVVFCLLATAGFALGPALKHSRADILTDLKVQTGDDPAPRRWGVVPRNPLVAAQVALSLTLLIATGLFLRMAGAISPSSCPSRPGSPGSSGQPAPSSRR